MRRGIPVEMDTNELELRERLAPDHPARESAIAELRVLLMKALHTGLSGRAGADHAFMEDVAQVSLLKILAKLHTFEGRSKFSSWSIAIALRVAFNELRRKEWGQISLDELREKQESVAEEASTAPEPDLANRRNEMAWILRSLIRSELTPKQGDVLFLELSGMPQEEIARELGSSRNAVYKLFHDARKALRRALEARGFKAADIAEVYSENTSHTTT